MNNEIRDGLKGFKRKFYLNRLIKGILIVALVAIGVWVLFSSAEYFLSLDKLWRGILFFSFISIITFLVIGLVLYPFLGFLGINDKVSDEAAAKQIGNHFTDIQDRLLNLIQLSQVSGSALAKASIQKTSPILVRHNFSNAVNLRINLKYVRFFVLFSLLVAVITVSFPTVFIDSSQRIIRYDQDFVAGSPFKFKILNQDLTAFKDEDFALRVQLEGEAISAEMYIDINGRRSKLKKEVDGAFSHIFRKPYQDISFQLESAGYKSSSFLLTVVERAAVNSFEIDLLFPNHTGLQRQSLQNVGKLIGPEGTTVFWNVNSNNSSRARIVLNNEDTLNLEKSSDNFTGSLTLKKSGFYKIEVENEFGPNENIMEYPIEVIPDIFPTITAEFYVDTILYEYVIVAGNAKDDYGIREIAIVTREGNEPSKSGIPVISNAREQSYYQRIDLDSSFSTKRERLEIFTEVTDNDQINNFKKARSKSLIINLPNQRELKESLEAKGLENEKELERSIERSKDLNSKIEEIQNRLKSKKELGWQEERLLQEILEQRKKLQEDIQKLSENFQKLNDSQNKFLDRDEEIQKKAAEIQELMSEILDEETQKLYEELEKLLEEQAKSEDIQDLLDQMNGKEMNLEQELERTLELFKRLKLESKLEQASNELEELAQKQEELAEKTLDDSNNIDSLRSEQTEIEEEFNKVKEDLKEAEELNQELKKPEPLEDFSDELNEISESMEEADEQLQEQNRQGTQKQQQKSSQQMKQLSQKMKEMQSSMEMEMFQEDIDNLEDIVDNLVKLSFKEEALIKDFREVRQVDPRFVELSQSQLRLKDDAKVIQDSLLSLANRVVQISNFVTREVTQMNEHIDNAVDALKDRNRGKALSHQQFAMASINNLSLLLSDILAQMQEAMASQSGTGKGKDKKQAESIGDLKGLQKQLSEQIKELKESGIKGRKLSEQLAKMAAQQEMIRNQLREFEEQLKGQPGNEEAGDNLGELLKELEQNEIDLVNKRLTNELLERQKRIETRMLEAEESLKDQGFDEKRKGESANDYEKRRPEAFEEYFKEKEKELELLKNVPLELSPFYKKELNDYFRRISSDIQ